MPVPYQIYPPGSLLRPKIVTQINDNTEVTTTNVFGGGNASAIMCVFTSPKGKDRVVQTINNGQSEFTSTYGLGPHSMYGQPLLNAYAAATAATTTNAMVHCLRVTADNASYSNNTLVAKYRVGTNPEDPTQQILYVKFVVVPSAMEITDLQDLENAYIPPEDPDPAGYTETKIFSVAYVGRGDYGKNIRYRITTERDVDKLNDYKNYNFDVFRNETVLEQIDSQVVTFVEDAIDNGESIFADDVINSESDYIHLMTFTSGFETLYNAYKAIVPETTFTLNDFDPLLGIDKYTRTAIPQLVIEPATPSADPGQIAVDLSVATGISLLGGSDGDLAADSPIREATMNLLYKKAFAGEIDPLIVSRNRFPTSIIMDANFDSATKLELVSLAIRRTDCMAMLDCGTEIYTKASVGAYFDANFDNIIANRVVTFEPYAMEIRDPFSAKVITVTSTWWLCMTMFGHWFTWGGKHKPLAGNQFGIISGQIENSTYPIFEDELDADMMDELADKHMNIAKLNPSQVVVRSMQNTSQEKLTALTEQNNVLVLLDIKRACERLAASLEYEFADAGDLARFNTYLEPITAQFQDAQVASITANFAANEWESERGIIHLYVAMVCRNLVKTTIIEIDVNRA